MSRQSYKEIYFHFNADELKQRGLDKRADDLITDFMVEKDFASFHSGYRSLDPMTSAEFYSILIELTDLYPWIRPCAEEIECLHVGELHTFDFTDRKIKKKDLRTGEVSEVEDEQPSEGEEQSMSDTPWHFVVAFDEDKIKQHGTTVEDVRAAINEIAEHNGMEEVEPGTWIVKPEAQDWMAQSLTLNLLAKRPDILRFISKCTFYEGKDGSGDFFKVMNLNRAN